jgi:hypothetical protein
MESPTLSAPKPSRTLSSTILPQLWVLSIVMAGIMTILLLIPQIPIQRGVPQAEAKHDDSQAAMLSPTIPPSHHDVMILPGKEPFVATGQLDEKGNPVRIACATCHTTKPVNATAVLGKPLTQFHQNLIGNHGKLSCTSCHNSTDGYASLRLADGRSVAYANSMMLCAQCHGPQYRDYQHGAHGGMKGFWDLSKGGRTRHTCTTCHDAHAPKYPTVTPAPPPHVRFPSRGGHD